MCRRVLSLILVVLACLLNSGNAKAQGVSTSVFASGLKAPVKSILTPKGNLLVAEAGNGPNTGRISIIDGNGNRRTLIDGLPSGLAPPNLDPFRTFRIGSSRKDAVYHHRCRGRHASWSASSDRNGKSKSIVAIPELGANVQAEPAG
jgi:glucose/arabinose dehydrogenase